MKVSRTAVAVAAGAAFLLSSCSSTAPGVAAEVNGQRITDKQVDAFAEVLCSLGSQGSQGSSQPTKSARFSSLQILLGDQLASGMTDVQSVDQQSVSQAMQQLATSRDALPESLKSTFDAVAREYAVAQTAILDVGRKSLESQGKTKVSDQDAFTEGERLRTAYAGKASIEVDPRYGQLVNGKLQPSDGSLSVPVSSFAQQASASQPPAGLVSQLPASQKCS